MSRTNRIYVDAPLAQGADIRLAGKAGRHVSRVLRLKAGDEINVFDGRGREHGAQISSCRGDDVRIVVGAAVDPLPESPARIRLLQGISRGERMDLVIQKTTELGVAGIQPVFTSRSVVRLSGDRAKRRTEHWRGVAAAACEQCGRATLPDVDPPLPLSEAIEAVGIGGLGLLLDAAAETPLPSVSPTDGRVTLLIGPEGGLNPRERQAAVQAGFVPVRLGPRIMRTETAAVVAVALIQAVWGDLRPSRP